MNIFLAKLSSEYVDIKKEVDKLGKVTCVFTLLPRVIAIETLLSLEELEKSDYIEKVEEDRFGSFY